MIFCKKSLNKDKLNLQLSFLKAVNTIQTTFKKKLASSLSYNYDVKILIEQLNAYRFKTPVITPEILLTILEEKETTGGKLLKLL